MARTVKDLCKLQPGALDVRVNDQVERLEDLIDAEGDGRAFFEKTHVTGGMDTLVREGIARLAGESTSGVFHLKQAMGGGKTHLLVGLGLLAKHRSLRDAVCGEMPHVHGFDEVRIAAFNGRNSPDNYFWGVVADALGKPANLKKFWDGGPRRPARTTGWSCSPATPRC